MNKTTQKRVLAQLAECQKGYKARTLEPAALLGYIAEAEAFVKTLRPQYRHLIYCEWNNWVVAKAYGHKAEGTQFVISAFTEKGEAKTVEVFRGEVRNYPTNRLHVPHHRAMDYAKRELGITAENHNQLKAAIELIYAACNMRPDGMAKWADGK